MSDAVENFSIETSEFYREMSETNKKMLLQEIHKYMCAKFTNEDILEKHLSVAADECDLEYAPNSNLVVLYKNFYKEALADIARIHNQVYFHDIYYLGLKFNKFEIENCFRDPAKYNGLRVMYEGETHPPPPIHYYNGPRVIYEGETVQLPSPPKHYEISKKIEDFSVETSEFYCALSDTDKLNLRQDIHSYLDARYNFYEILNDHLTVAADELAIDYEGNTKLYAFNTELVKFYKACYRSMIKKVEIVFNSNIWKEKKKQLNEKFNTFEINKCLNDPTEDPTEHPTEHPNASLIPYISSPNFYHVPDGFSSLSRPSTMWMPLDKGVMIPTQSRPPPIWFPPDKAIDPDKVLKFERDRAIESGRELKFVDPDDLDLK